MNKIFLSILIVSTVLLFNACGELTTESEMNDNSTEDEGQEIIEEENEVVYLKLGNCDEFIAGIDFSSFCFTDKNTPTYRLIQDTESNCQYQISNDIDFQNIDLSIAFSDFEKSFNGKEPMPELAKTIFNTVYEKKKKERTLHADAKQIDGLGDDAYMGFNQKGTEQYLGVRVGNVVFTFVFHHDEGIANQSCVSAKEDLIKIGRLVIENFQN